MSFESELKQGRFSIGECKKCQRITWPPNDFCSNCFEKIDWRRVKEPGIVLEHSSNDDKAFALVEFEGMIKVLGVISGTPKIGQRVKIAECGFDGSPKFLFTPE